MTFIRPFIIFITILFACQSLPTCLEAVAKFPDFTCPDTAVLGQGASATTYIVLDKEGRKRLLKVQSFYSKAERDKVRKEIATLNLFDHPNIAKLIKVERDDKWAYFIMQLGEKGTLKSLPAYESRKGTLEVFKRLVDAVQHIHSKLKVHADIKSDNIVVTKGGNPLIIDFDLAVGMGEVEEQRGSLPYMDPAILFSETDKLAYTEKVDVYSLGVVLYEMIHKKTPFAETNIKQLKKKIEKGTYEIKQGVDVDLINLIHECLVRDPNQRLGLADIKLLIESAQKRQNVLGIAQPMTFSNVEEMPTKISSLVSQVGGNQEMPQSNVAGEAGMTQAQKDDVAKKLAGEGVSTVQSEVQVKVRI